MGILTSFIEDFACLYIDEISILPIDGKARYLSHFTQSEGYMAGFTGRENRNALPFSVHGGMGAKESISERVFRISLARPTWTCECWNKCVRT